MINYRVEKTGKIWSDYTEDYLVPAMSNGYPIVALVSGGKRSSIRVHRLVAKTFLSNPNNYPQVNHINGDKTDNRVENLEWCTQSHNIKHAYATGLMTPYTRKEKCETH